MSPPFPRRRKRWIVNPRFQWSLTIKISLIAVALAGFFAWSLYFLIWRSLLRQGESLGLSSQQQTALWSIWGVVLLGALILSAIIIMKLSHRVAGQLSRFERAVDLKLIKEQPPPIITRRDDYFHDFETELNRYLANRKFP